VGAACGGPDAVPADAAGTCADVLVRSGTVPTEVGEAARGCGVADADAAVG
jgi:hypothetical protein